MAGLLLAPLGTVEVESVASRPRWRSLLPGFGCACAAAALCVWFALQISWDARNPAWMPLDPSVRTPKWLAAGVQDGWPLLPGPGANVARRWEPVAHDGGVSADLALRLISHPDPGVRTSMGRRLHSARLPSAAALAARIPSP